MLIYFSSIVKQALLLL